MSEPSQHRQTAELNTQSTDPNLILDDGSMTVQQALDKAGGFGRYQCLLLFILCLANGAPGLVFYGVAFFEDQPPYLCTYNLPQFVGH